MYHRELEEIGINEKNLEKENVKLQLEIVFVKKEDTYQTVELMKRELKEGLLMRIELLNKNETLQKEL